jgi:hypothetical protein
VPVSKVNCCSVRPMHCMVHEAARLVSGWSLLMAHV